MCGLVGIFDYSEQREINRDLLHKMNETQFHRGPDEGGLHTEPGLGLGHRRLSIIDLSNGHQPLFNKDRSIVVVYNGEIYNFQELRQELEAHGHQFSTHCDTEVIVYAWQQWGEECVNRLRGMFAFAIWDRNKQTLFLARDRMGIKPLYYAALPNGQFIFGSELKSLYAHPELPRKIDEEAVEDYFALGYVPEPKTILQHACKLLPGHSLLWKRGNAEPRLQEYWDVPFDTLPNQKPEDLQPELVERLKEAVDIRMIAEVPLGAFLSGGVDSSAVVALMAELSEDPVKTCSISFGDPKYNESQFAAKVAEQYKTDHRVEQVDVDDYDLIDHLAGLYDEPYADSSAIPTYRVCELARKQVVVALSGDGGDENFAGYRRHRWHMNEEKIRSKLPQFVRGPLFGAMGALYPKADWAPKFLRAKSTFQALAKNSHTAYLHSVGVVNDGLRKKLFNSRFHSDLAGYSAHEVFRRYAEKAPTDHPLSLIQYLDMKTYLPGDILTKVDRASMAHSLEVRVPILDHHFVEWVSGIAPEQKLVGRDGKHIFKQSLKPHLSDEILYRAKMGFGVPISSWFRGPLRERVRSAILGPVLDSVGIFDRAFLTRLVDQHQSGTHEHGAVLWSLLMFESFCRQSLGLGNTTPAERVEKMAVGL